MSKFLHQLSTAKQVYQQLIGDFPGHAIAWVKRTTWIGPVKVPIDQINMDNRASWKASHEPEKVQLHMDLIKQNKSSPIILIKIAGKERYICVDAHHRLLGYEALGQESVAYIGFIQDKDIEAALTAHSQQYSGGSKLNGTDEKIADIKTEET